MTIFRFKQFEVDDGHCAMKIGTDGVVLGAWADCRESRTILDVGSGSGLIALMLAQRCNAEITAIDIDDAACADAAANFAASPWHDRLRAIATPFDDYKPLSSPDLIVSNPPFFSEGQLSPDSERAAARHEASLNFESLIDYAAEYLAHGGRLEFIYQYGREDDIIYKAEMRRLKLRRICHLRQTSSRPWIRTMFSFDRIDGPIERSAITIRTNQGYTSEFARLCRDYYLEL